MTLADLAPGLRADVDVTLGYDAERGSCTPLVLGRDARVRSGTVLYTGTEIGARFQSGHNVVVREECRLGEDVSIWSNTVIDYGCRIGDGVRIHSNCYVAQYTVIEAGAFLAPGVTFANDLYPGDEASAGLMAGPLIEAGAQLGVNVTVLPYVTIGRGAIIGAGSVVTKDVAPDALVYGNPAATRGDVRDLRDIRERVVVDDRRRLHRER